MKKFKFILLLLCCLAVTEASAVTVRAYPSSNAGADLYQDGYDDGYERGVVTGRAEGREAGYNSGYDNGYINGYADGETAGYDTGHSDGVLVGRSEAAEKAKVEINLPWMDLGIGLTVGAAAGAALMWSADRRRFEKLDQEYRAQIRKIKDCIHYILALVPEE